MRYLFAFLFSLIIFLGLIFCFISLPLDSKTIVVFHHVDDPRAVSTILGIRRGLSSYQGKIRLEIIESKYTDIDIEQDFKYLILEKKPDIVVCLDYSIFEHMAKKFNDRTIIFCNIFKSTDIDEYRSNGLDMTGIFSSLDFKDFFLFIKQILPGIKTISAPHSKVNSQSSIFLEHISNFAKSNGIRFLNGSFVDLDWIKSSDLVIFSDALCKYSDIDIFYSFCKKNFIPLITMHKHYVESGKSLAAFHYSDYSNGEVLAIIINTVLLGHKALDFPTVLSDPCFAKFYVSSREMISLGVNLAKKPFGVVVLS